MKRRQDGKARRGSRDRGRGVAVIEFALIMPLLLMLVFGIVEFGQAYQARLTVTHAAREGVRVLAVTDNQPAAEAAALAAATGIDQALVTIVATPCAAGMPAVVVVTYPVVIDVPGTGTYNLTVEGKAVMTCLD
ncbi:MAG: TadE/TadG family type IV pilus assembly protein [Acidimicrobiales bacterium]